MADSLVRCRRCGKPNAFAEDYYRAGARKRAKMRVCGKCSERKKQKYVRSPEAVKRTLDKAKNRRRAEGRGTPGACDVCGDYVECRQWDHDHKTGKFRGHLCRPCNFTLGFTKDDPARLRKLIEYLEKVR